MVDKKNNPGEFDDFDDEDFSDVDFDDPSMDDAADFDDLPEEDASLDEEFDDGEDWGDPATENKKPPEKKKPSGDKKGGLSFNTMVIIGAVFLGGGIMVFNVMKESAKQQANPNQGGFQSTVDLNSVTGADAFDSSQVATAPQESTPQVETPAPAPASQDQQGFLDNPEAMATPPQPTPIAPSENETVTAMPTEEAPKVPDQAQAEQVAELPSDSAQTGDQPASSAEDILKKAMENREQKLQENAAVEEKSAAPAEPMAAEKTAEALPTPVAEPVAQEPVPVSAPAVDDSALKRIEEKLTSLNDRMTQIESNVGSIKDTKETDYVEIQQAVADLKEDMQALKDRPAASAPKAAVRDPAEEKPATVSKPKATTTKKSKPAAKSAPVSAKTNTVWELRAAQPGRAWVSKPGASDMQSVVVGQSLPGIGQITAITYQNGRWTVYGTGGQIQQ